MPDDAPPAGPALPVRPRIVLAALLTGFYAAHAVALLMTGAWPGVLWSCHLASPLAAVGVAFGRPRPVGVAACLQVFGLPAWIAAVAGGLVFYPTSTLTHVGSFALTLFWLSRTGMPHGAWIRAVAVLPVLWLLTRLVTPNTQNVNLAHTYWFGFEGRYVSYPVFLVGMLGVAALAFYGFERLLARAFGRPDVGRFR